MKLLQTIRKKSDIALFTTPSHTQKLCLLKKFKHFYECDISETDAYGPTEALKESEAWATKIYKTKSTSYLTNGSTSGVIAAVLTCAKRDDKVLIWNNSHICHKNAVELAGATPVFYDLDFDEEWGIYKEISPEEIEKYLKSENIKAVIVTSPSYEGIISDIKTISEICHKYGTYLIVDSAHGALYPFCNELPESGIQYADFVIQSLHKTAGGLNPTALLHNNTDLDEKAALAKFITTSPSYPILASIEKNIAYLNSQKGRLKIKELLSNIEKLKSQTYSGISFYKGNDPTKILIKHGTLSGEELSEFLYNHKIEDEIMNKKSTMLLTGIGTDLRKLNKLQKALKKLTVVK